LDFLERVEPFRPQLVRMVAEGNGHPVGDMPGQPPTFDQGWDVEVKV
jgi:hypothetical protein